MSIGVHIYCTYRAFTEEFGINILRLSMKNTKLSTKSLLFLFLIHVVVYLCLALFLPPDKASLDRYNIIGSQYYLIILFIAVPLILIWSIAFYGFVKFRSYSSSIIESKDGQALYRVSQGLGFLAFGLPFSSIFSSLANYYSRVDPSMSELLTILNSYISLFIAGSAYYLAWKGSQKLDEVEGVELKPVTWINVLTGLILLLIVGSYVYVYLTNPATLAVPDRSRTSYTMLELVVSILRTFLYLVTWCLGLIAASKMLSYSNSVQGIIYKKAVRFLAIGVFCVILSSIFTQSLQLLGNFFSNLNLSGILQLIAVLLVAISIGYILIALGANKLQKIEDA